MKDAFKKVAKRCFVDGLAGLGIGMMSSLIIGVILSQFAKISALSWLAPFAEAVGAKSPVVGAAAGVAIALALKSKTMVIIASAVSGAIGYMSGDGLGGPVGAYVAAIIGAELGNLITGKTKFDILLCPLTVIICGGAAGLFAGPYVGAFMNSFGQMINSATQLQPFWMGIVVSVFMGMALTAPISSAAIAISLGLSGLAAGAATVGCCANMIGFAIMSYEDNSIGGSISVGIGTSMLHVSNIIKRPIIWIPPIVASAVLGPVSTLVFAMTNNKIGAGMGTSALVGPINTFIDMSPSNGALKTILMILILQIILPAVITFAVYKPMRNKGIIRPGDLKLA